MNALGDALPREMARVRDEVMPAYLLLGIAAGPALALMKDTLDSAAKAMAHADLPKMIRAYKSLQGFSL